MLGVAKIGNFPVAVKGFLETTKAQSM